RHLAGGVGQRARQRLGLGRNLSLAILLVDSHSVHSPLGRPCGSSLRPRGRNGSPPMYFASSRATSAMTASLMNFDCDLLPSKARVPTSAPLIRSVSSASC